MIGRDVLDTYPWGVRRLRAGGLRSVVAATAHPAGTARKSGQNNG